jgi:hypothetical protein
MVKWKSNNKLNAKRKFLVFQKTKITYSELVLHAEQCPTRVGSKNTDRFRILY